MDEPKYFEVITRPLVRERALLIYADRYDLVGDDGLPCEHCGTWVKNFQMHHRQFRSRGGDWRPSNIIALCKKCHQKVHRGPTGWARDRGLAVSTWAHPEEVPAVVWYEDNRVFFDNEGNYIPEAA